MGIYYYYQQPKIGTHIERIGHSCFLAWVDDTFIGAFGDRRTAENAIASHIAKGKSGIPPRPHLWGSEVRN